VGQYKEGIGVFKIEKFLLFVTFFFIFCTISIVYNLNNSYFIYEICSKFKQNQFGRYLKGIGVFKFENFHYSVTLF